MGREPSCDPGTSRPIGVLTLTVLIAHCGDFCVIRPQTSPAKPNISNRGLASFRARRKWLKSFISFSVSQLSDPLTHNSGSAYRGSNPWGAAKLESTAYDLRFPPKQPTGNKNR